MKVLVTGGAGFIGSHVAELYFKSGHKVTVFDNEISGSRKNLPKGIEFVRGDITDTSSLRRLFNKRRFQTVNHHAAQIDVRHSVEDPQLDAKINIFGLLQVLRFSKENNVKKILFSSSGGTVYGECRRPASEKDPEVPLSPYGVSKLAGEKYIQTFSALHGLSFTIFRYANVYGPRQDPHGEAGVVSIFTEFMLRKKPCFIFGDGKQTRDFVYVGDVAEANLNGLFHAKNQIINVGTGKETSVLQLFNKTAQLIEGANNKPIYREAREGELRRSVLAVRKARQTLKWSPNTSLTDGLRKTVDYFRIKKSGL